MPRPELTVGQKVQVGTYAFVLILGCAVGASFQPESKVEFIKVPRTKTVVLHKTETKVVHKGFNDACKSALEYADTITHATAGFDSTSTEQLDLLSRSREAMVAGDLNETSRIITDQNQLNSRTLGYVKTISETLFDYDAAKKECEADGSTN